MKAVKEQLREFPQGGIGYGALRYLGAEAHRKALAELPRAQVSFNYLGQLDTAEEETAGTEGEAPRDEEELRLMLAPEPTGPNYSARLERAHLIDLEANVAAGRLQLSLTYSRAFHHRETAERLVEEVTTAIRSLVRHCMSPQAGGYTPSDFPLVRLGQADLDRIAGQRSRDRGPLSPLPHPAGHALLPPLRSALASLLPAERVAAAGPSGP